MKYLLEHDTVHGRFDGSCVVTEDGALMINGMRVTLSKTRDPSAIPWSAAGVEYVLECTGAFLTTEKCQAHLQPGVRKVVISAPASDEATPTIVVGVNDTSYDSATMHVVSCASCTTNGLAPLVKLIHERFGIAQGLMTTIHAATASQVIVDGTSAKDWRAGRAASANIIPASTGAAKAVAKAYPPMKGKLTGMAVRVPVVDVSMIDLTLTLETATTYEEIKSEVKLASETYAKGIVGYTDEAVVSSDFIGETSEHSPCHPSHCTSPRPHVYAFSPAQAHARVCHCSQDRRSSTPRPASCSPPPSSSSSRGTTTSGGTPRACAISSGSWRTGTAPLITTTSGRSRHSSRRSQERARRRRRPTPRRSQS